MSKARAGNFFEDFALDQEIVHTAPRTVTAGDQALYTALTGARFAVHASDQFAETLGYPRAPLDDLLVFHVVFGKTVPEISLNAIANLGYAGCRFGVPAFPGDTLRSTSRVVGLKENSNRKTGVVYVHSTGHNQHGEMVLEFYRWVMVRKRDPESPTPEPSVPELPQQVETAALFVPPELIMERYDYRHAGQPETWDDYAVGEKIDHLDAMTLEEAEHQMATRLYHNTARVHFNAHVERQGRFGRRIVYGGHIISIARAISFNGLANAFRIAAINGGSHTAPTFAGDTLYAWSEVLDKQTIAGRDDLGALRLRTVATKDLNCADYPLQGEDGKMRPEVVLDLDYTVLMPRRM